MLREYKINISVMTEMKKKLRSTKDLKDYVMIYRGMEQRKTACCGIVVLIDRKWQHRFRDYTFVNERIITVRLKFYRGYLTVTYIHAPEGQNNEIVILR